MLLSWALLLRAAPHGVRQMRLGVEELIPHCRIVDRAHRVALAALLQRSQAFGVEGPVEPVVFSTAAACAAWIYLRSSVEESSSSQFPGACKLVMGICQV